MRVTYFIQSGTLGEIAGADECSAQSIKEALDDFKSYVRECDRFGTDTSNACIEIFANNWNESRLYKVGPRNGIVRIN